MSREGKGALPPPTAPVSISFAEHPTLAVDGNVRSLQLRPDEETQEIQTLPRVERAASEGTTGEVNEGERGPLSGSRISHFRVGSLLGKGGMGRVYRAFDERLQREVALKVLPPDVASDPERRARLMIEARSAAAVTHPNVAAIYEVGEDSEQVFIAMELVEGDTLRARMVAGLSLRESVGLALQITRGLARAHEKGVLHRDLKPDNVIVGAEGEVKLLDFGLAKRVDAEDVERVRTDADTSSGVTQAGVIMGTPGYMSPEQILNDGIDHRSDIFAIGVLLYEMVTGVHPFRGRVSEVLRSTLMVSPPPPSEINPDVSPELEALIMSALVKRREERTASTREMVRELERIAGAGPPDAVFPGVRRSPERTTEREGIVAQPPSSQQSKLTELAARIAEAERKLALRKRAGAWLTAEATPFIGRTSQIEAIVAMVRRDRARLVTLTGPGGTGKTRLSVEVARALREDFPDGVVQVLLGSVNDPSLVPATIAETLGIAKVPGRPILDAIEHDIGEGRALLVLDNFEQIVSAAPAVGELLARCPSLVVIVTSREVLKIAAEREHAVPPLDVPSEAADEERLAACEAAALFSARVRAVRPDFAITRENAPIVASVCARLEGIPLAIELAASRMKVLTLPALHKRLIDRLGFLKGTDRDRAERHQTLRAAIDWSYNLLDEPQRMLLRRVAVFSGGFFIESAEEVAGELGYDVLDGLTALVDKSLLIRREVDGEMRLSALDTIREYALERLDATGEANAIRLRHAEHVSALVREIAPRTMGRDFRSASKRLFTEADNIRAALGFALDRGEHVLAARMLSRLLWFWCTYSKLEEGYDWAKRALAVMTEESVERGVALEVAAWLSMMLGDFDAVLQHGREGVALWTERGDPDQAMVTMIPFGLATAVTGSFAEGVAMVEQAKDVCRQRGDEYGAALALNVLGELSRATGDYESAGRSYDEALALLDRLGNVTTKSLFSINVAYCRMHKGDWRGAAAVVIPTLETSVVRGSAYDIAFYLAVMGCVAVVRGREADGLRLYGAAKAALRTIGAAVLPADQEEIDRYVTRAREALGAAESDAMEADGARMTRQAAIALSISLRG